jgi:hypothetical protein
LSDGEINETRIIETLVNDDDYEKIESIVKTCKENNVNTEDECEQAFKIYECYMQQK